jgi:methyltransferase (TIGR00027 family)
LLLDRLRAEVPGPHLLAFSRWMCVRARFPEDIAELAAASGICQYVSLGAGLDSFAYRRGDLLGRLRVFEVDHPATQAWKRRRLTELGVQHPAGLVFAPVDFERQTLQDGLAQAAFGFGQPAVVSWVGVTMYLTLDAIHATLATLAGCQPGTRIVLTYNRPLLGYLGVSCVYSRKPCRSGHLGSTLPPREIRLATSRSVQRMVRPLPPRCLAPGWHGGGAQ